LRYGGGGAPAWVEVLQMAEAWGQHPDDIMHRPGGLRWAARWGAYQRALARIRAMDKR